MKTAAGIVFFATVALLALGMVALVSASTGDGGSDRLKMQMLWSILGLAACGLAAAKDYQWLRHFSWILLGAAVVMLVAVLIPGVGKTINGATRWIVVGSFRMQPSEFAKIAMIIALAHYGAYYQRKMTNLWHGLIIPGAIMAPVVGLIFVEPDVGASALLCAVGGLLMILAGTRLRYFIPPACAMLAALVVFLVNDPTRSARLEAWLNPEATKMGKGLQAYQSIVAIGKGGIHGVGLGEGLQKHGFVPEHHTDFILSVIGEELGLIATLLVVAAFMAIVLGGIVIAWHARETFGMLLAAGITFMIGFQAIINIGVVTGALPNKGLSLPFISYGGSNLIMLLGAIGLLLNVARYGKKHRRLDEEPMPPNESLSYQFV